MTYDPAGLPADVRTGWPHLSGYDALRLPAKYANNRKLLTEILSGQIAVAEYDDLGRLIDATGVQIPGVLDDLYRGASKRQLGLSFVGSTPVFSLWAPTAKNVTLLVDPPGGQGETRISMGRDRDGIWTTWGRSRWVTGSYRYEVEVYVPATGKVEKNLVTDPYSVALTTNSTASVIADLGDPHSPRPAGTRWANRRSPSRRTPPSTSCTSATSPSTTTTVPAAHRGTYLAFTDTRSAGMRHLRALADGRAEHRAPAARLRLRHDRREPGRQQAPACDLPRSAGRPDRSSRRASTAAADADGFNWGYDPLHYTVPEGSYATDPDGARRTREFRQMVAGAERDRPAGGDGRGLQPHRRRRPGRRIGARPDRSRLLPPLSTRPAASRPPPAAPNTATEHAMMEKLMVDSVVTWARQYKVDGFRFDLMGHHPQSTCWPSGRRWTR